MLACCSVPDYRELMRMAAAGRDRGRKAEERVAASTDERGQGAPAETTPAADRPSELDRATN
ncbi:hypothetical protein PRN20_16075 [Devosia sp. ZB163]|uniref:hypothetical protein n=1 Tax=Devosia sp. ZB163 TaxID=3025938 RepID=UPI002361405E|nr:hypothetical protein [Devosia sp. ZB163]MDC9825248.1 hypothetical protein [Devosia sp. ZB163]